MQIAIRQVLLLTGMVLSGIATVLGQKPALGPATTRSWPVLEAAVISPDGRYLAYTIREPATDADTVFLRAVNGTWERRFGGWSGGNFSPDGSQFLLRKQDSIGIGVPGRGELSTMKAPRSPDYDHMRQLLPDSLRDGEPVGFNADSGYLFFRRTLSQGGRTAANPAVWAGTDATLYSDRRSDGQASATYALDVRTGAFRMVLHGNEVPLPDRFNEVHEKVVVVAPGPGGADEWPWNPASLSAVYLVSIRTGARVHLANRIPAPDARSYTLSPHERYVVYYRSSAKQYYSYETATGVRRVLTAGIRTTWTTFARDDEPYARYQRMGYLGWFRDGSAVLIYDQNDIWALDPSGTKAPVNLTNGYGKRRGMQFRTALQDSPNDNRLLLDPGQPAILKAFDRISKDDGFFRIRIGQKGDPERLTMQPYEFCGSMEADNGESNQVERTDLIKARDTDVYLVRRMDASEAPNWFVSTDLTHFTLVSDHHPEKAVNWLTAELITYRTAEGQTSQAILYKPENFDPTKKYPVIFYYYERLSDGLHAFFASGSSGGPLNIPYFVSNGYLVCLPDIHYTIGHPGRSALNSIIGAADCLAKRSYVDAAHMGIEGHSFGGFETEYIVAHSHRFAAACAASGWSDFIGAYNFIRDGGSSRQYYYDMYRERIGATLWQRPDLYMENSPVLKAAAVTTPLLMMNNRGDRDVDFYMGVEFFTALRRLQKTVWMLQYDKGGHTVSGADAADLDRRMMQFFDHYLKGRPAPEWMKNDSEDRLK